jgi:putative ABC transport system permease protein
VAVAVLSLGLGIGVNTTLFGVFNAVFLRQVSASDPGGIWRIWPPGANKISYANYRDLRDSKVLSELAGSHGAELNLRTSGDIERVTGEILTGNFFQVVGVAPAIGRAFGPSDENVAVISNGAWKKRFAGDPNVLGRVVNLNGQPYTVIGVLAKDYRSAAGFGLSPEFYLPISRATDGDLNQRSRASLDMFCRLPKGTSVQQAAAALAPVTAEL